MKRLAAALLLCTVMPHARAETYVQAGLADVHVTYANASRSSFNGWELASEGRYDLKASPLFLTGSLFTGETKSDFGSLTLSDTFTGLGLGGGWAFVQNVSHEINAYARYEHQKDHEEISGFGGVGSTTSDQLHVGAGGHVWVNRLFRAFSSLGYMKGSHKVRGIEAVLGAEWRLRPDIGLFVEYDYARDDDTRAGLITNDNVLGAGAKWTFGGVR